MPKRTISLKDSAKRDMFFYNFIPREFGNKDSTVWRSQRHTDRSVLFEHLFVSFLSDRRALASFFPISGPGV